MQIAAGISRDDAFPPYEVGEAVTYVQGASLVEGPKGHGGCLSAVFLTPRSPGVSRLEPLMKHPLNSIMPTSDSRRLKRAYGVRSAKQYASVIEHLADEVAAYEDFGALGLRPAAVLSELRFAHLYPTRVPGYEGIFLVASLLETFIDAIHRGMDVLMDDPNFRRITIITDVHDAYLRPWDELGEKAEAEPRLADLPEHVHWGNECFLLTEERLKEEVQSGNYTRLLHRTPYRPLPTSLPENWDLPV